MFDFFQRRAVKKPQVSSQYPLFTALCRYGAVDIYVANKMEDEPPLKAANISVLSNGNVIVFDENAEKVLSFFSVREIEQTARDFEKPERECDVSVLTAKKKFFFSFNSSKDKNIFSTVLNYERENLQAENGIKKV